MNRILASLLVTAIAGAGMAKADVLSESSKISRTAFIAEYDNTLAPLQFVKFCMNYSAECDANAAERMLPSPERAMQMLTEVNESVNEAISPVRKSTEPLLARWTIAPSAGDCNDYAVTKRHMLIAKGWPQSTLRLAVVKTDSGQGHLVLVARLNDGDVVLDNLSPKIQAWNLANYDWISMQSAENPRFWSAIGPRGQRQRAARLGLNHSEL